MAYVARIPDWFPTRKAAQVAAFFAIEAGGEINVLRVVKLIYLADRRSLEQRERPITGDEFVSMDFGPVNTFTFSYINGEAADRNSQWQEFVGRRNGFMVPLASPSIDRDRLDELSRADIRILVETWNKFSEIERFDLAEWTHEFCPEWQNPHGSSLPIHLQTIFAKLSKNDPFELVEEIQSERALTLELNART